MSYAHKILAITIAVLFLSVVVLFQVQENPLANKILTAIIPITVIAIFIGAIINAGTMVNSFKNRNKN